MRIDLPPVVENKARKTGARGRRWLRELPDTVASLVTEWDLTLGPTMTSGTSGFVAAATTGTGEAAVLKVVLPDDMEGGPEHFDRAVLFHQLGGGHGTARLLAHDRPRLSLLMERLGPNLVDAGYSGDQIRAAVCECLVELWRQPVPAGSPLRDGGEKAAYLAGCIERWWTELDHPCDERTIEVVLGFIAERAAAHDPATAVLVHGDAHQWNTLQAGDGHKLIDPEGLLSTPAHDLSVLMRESADELLAGDPLELGLARAQQLHELTGIDLEAIWQWGSIERLSTGLYCLFLNEDDWARDFLTVADAWARR